ncbi:MAG TPA: hypothetical protein VGC80_01920, partial [Acetobacteraceae bacterium]
MTSKDGRTAKLAQCGRVGPNQSSVKQQDGRMRMGRLSTALLAGVALIAAGGAVFAHHSFAMFDQDHP